jgi:FkbM family methyltransferase
MRRFKERDMDPRVRKIFEDNYYRKPLYAFTAATMANRDILVDADLDESSIVFDVGAYVGDWSEKVAKRYRCTIHAFEPASGARQRAETRLGDEPRVHVHPYGLGSTDITAQLAMAGPGSSIYSDSSPMGSFEPVEIRDVVAVLDELQVEEIDLLKVNIEGAEFDLQLGLGVLATARQLSHLGRSCSRPGSPRHPDFGSLRGLTAGTRRRPANPETEGLR